MTHRAAVAVLFTCFLTLAGAAAPSSGMATYRVKIALYPGEDGAAVAKRLAATYRGELQTPLDVQAAFLISVSEASARLLGQDHQVESLEAISSSPVSPPSREPTKAAATPGGARLRTDAVATWQLGDGDGLYQYDGSGNIKKIGAHVFVYDEKSRLRSGGAPGQSQSYTYDGFGNIKTITTDGDPQVASVGVNSQTNRADVSGSPYNVYGGYDVYGNMLWNQALDEFQYDALSMVTKAKVGGVWRSYVYTASDERIGTIQLSASQTEVRSDWTIRDGGGQVLRRLSRANGVWSWTEDYVYRNGVMLAAEVSGPEKVRHFHVDHLGTPRLVTGNGGVELSRHTYYSFGSEIGAQTSGEKQFTGHERDSPSLDYMHARYYGPKWGRFLSVDPVWVSADLRQPQSWNRYSYVRNNPINRIDPDGRADVEIKYPPAAANWTQAQKDEWNRKWAAEQAAARAGNASVPTNPPARSSGFRARLEKIFGPLPKSQDADHIQSLATNGLDDAAVNGQGLDRSVNRSSGPLLRNAIKNLKPGTPITNIKFPKLGWVGIAFALFSSDPVQAAVSDLTFSGGELNPSSHETRDLCANNPACTTASAPPGQ
jgi:RHS repeat-associated protein